jgi:hypothetical protein
MSTECITQHLKDEDDAPVWPAVERGAAAIVLVGVLLLLPAGAYIVSLTAT